MPSNRPWFCLFRRRYQTAAGGMSGRVVDLCGDSIRLGHQQAGNDHDEVDADHSDGIVGHMN